MRASLKHDGTIYLSAETSIEQYAINQWIKEWNNGGDSTIKITLVDNSGNYMEHTLHCPNFKYGDGGEVI